MLSVLHGRANAKAVYILYIFTAFGRSDVERGDKEAEGKVEGGDKTAEGKVEGNDKTAEGKVERWHKTAEGEVVGDDV